MRAPSLAAERTPWVRPAGQTAARPLIGPRVRRVMGVAVIAAGVGLVVLVTRDGEPGFRALRGLAAVVASVATWRAVTGPRPIHAAAFAAGVLATAAGVAITVPWLTKAGVGPITVAGALMLAGGLTLLLSGAAALLRAVRGWWRVPSAAALAVVVFVAVWSLGQAVAATNVPPTELGGTTPADHGLAFRDVEFAAGDGVTLSGWYVPSTNGAAVVLLHGAGSTRSGVLDHTVVLARHGYGVLLYDARGHGHSDGRAMDFGWYGDVDVAGAVDFLRRQRDVDPTRIAAVGMSMGGEQAIGAMASVEHLRAVVAEGATNRVADDKAWLPDEFGWRGTIQVQLERVTFALADLLTDAAPPTALGDAVRAAAPRPVLLVAAGSVPDEAHAARFVRDGSPGTVEVWEVPDTGHTGALRSHPEEWTARVTTFLGIALS